MKRGKLSDKIAGIASRFLVSIAGCCAKKTDESREIFDDVADIFVRLFEDVDLVPTDIAAGLLLLHAQYKRDRLENPPADVNSEDVVSQQPNNFADNGQSTEQWMNATTAAYFMKYAMASYGYPLYLYGKLKEGCQPLMPPGYACCSCSSR